jgi:hypothetical protein
LAWISTFAALELAVVNLAATGCRQGVDTHTISPVQVEVSIPSINTSVWSGRNGRRSRKVGETGSRCLSSIGTLAALELRSICGGAVGSGQSVDAVAKGPVNIRGLVPDVNTSVWGGRDGRRSRQTRQTSSRCLPSILALAAF